MNQIATTFKATTTARTLLGVLALIFMHSSTVVSFVLAQGTTTITSTTGIGGLGTTVTTNGHTAQITGGARPGNGTNLFHSFDQFNVAHGETAQFLNTTPSLHTDNILSRVTGGTPSSIFGTIDTISYPGANLFLMNPAGVIFGPSATLNVSGSVAFTTADYLRLADNGANTGIFYADMTAASLLTSAPVAAFGFLSFNPAAIAVQESKLTVQPGRSISLVGSNITVQSGTLGNLADPSPLAPGKQVLIGGVASPGEMVVGTLASAANINGQSPTTLGTVQISNKSSIDTRGEGGGSILIRGGRLVVDESQIGSNTGNILLAGNSILIKNTAQVITFTTTTADAGHITLHTSGDITVDSAEVTSITATSSGHAGNIIFTSEQGTVSLTNSSVTSQTTSGSGNTGSIKMDAPHGDVVLDHAFLYTSSQGAGRPGGVQIAANNLFLTNEASIARNNFTERVGESINISLEGRLSLTGHSAIQTTTPVSSDAASLTIRSRDILITEGGKLETSTISSGNGGQLSLFTDRLQLTDGGKLLSRSRIDADLKEIPSGRGGAISIESYNNPGNLITINGSESGIFTSAEGSGAAGDIIVKAASVTLQNGGKLSAETNGISSKAKGGSITVNATNQVTLTDGASISARSRGPADAGNISINAGKQLDVDHGSITTQSNELNGGNITIQAIDLIRVVEGKISTSALNGGGNGGNITIDPKVVLLQNSEILAQANRGVGGDISITTPVFIADQSSRVDASTPFGLNGRITIQSPTSNLSGTVGQLASKTSPPQVLLQNRCVALAGGEQSTFLLAGRDALPIEPNGWLSSPVSMEHWTGEDTAHASRLMARNQNVDSSPVIAAHSNKSRVLSLRRLTPPGFLVRTFATEATGCPS